MLIRLGREPVVLPAPPDALTLQVAETRRIHAALGDDGTSAWLFPGGQPGQPVSAYQLGGRLRQIGIRCGQARSAALFQLATDLPAAALARMLGIHITVAVAWKRASGADEGLLLNAQDSRRSPNRNVHQFDRNSLSAARRTSRSGVGSVTGPLSSFSLPWDISIVVLT